LSNSLASFGSALTAAATMVGLQKEVEQVSAMLGLSSIGFKGASGESGSKEWGWSKPGDCVDEDTPLRMWWGAIPPILLGALAQGLRPGSKFHTAAPVPPAVENVEVGMDGRLSHWYFLHRSARNRRRTPRNVVEQTIQYLLALLPEEVEDKVVGAEWWVECFHGPGCQHTQPAPTGVDVDGRSMTKDPRRRGWAVNGQWTLPEHDGAFTSDFNSTRHLGLPFHFAVDRARLERGAGAGHTPRWAHPLLGSVLFLSGRSFNGGGNGTGGGAEGGAGVAVGAGAAVGWNAGPHFGGGTGGVVGPTLVCNQTREQVLGAGAGAAAAGARGGAPRVRGLSDAWVVEPVQGQYLLYRGDLLTAELPSRPPTKPAADDGGAREGTGGAGQSAGGVGVRGELPTQIRLHVAWWGRECKHGKPNKCVRSKKKSDYVSWHL
jgi:hypothetical protein